MDVRRALFLGLLCLLAFVPAAEAAKRVVPRGFHGTMFDGGVRSSAEAAKRDQFALMARTGVETVRTVFAWDEAQPEAGAQPDFSRTDELVANAVAHGIEPLPVVMYAPRWARRKPSVATSPPERPADYGAFLAQLVARYGPNGSLWAERPDLPRRPLRRWQVWNEPHLQYQWTVPRGRPGAFPRGYVALLRAAHQALRRADPGARAVLAGLTNDSWNHLRALYRAGARRWFDVAAMQSYTGRPSGVLAAVRRVRTVMSAARDGRKPLFVTEIGWPAARGRTPVPSYHRTLVTNDAGMAGKLADAYSLLARHRRRLRVARVYWYTWASSYRRGSIFNYSGLVRFEEGGYSRRRALRAYQRSARRLQGCVKTSAGSCR